MTGTAKTEVWMSHADNFITSMYFPCIFFPGKQLPLFSLQEKEFLKMFQMPVIEVPTNLSNIRKDLPIQAFAVRHLTPI